MTTRFVSPRTRLEIKNKLLPLAKTSADNDPACFSCRLGGNVESSHHHVERDTMSTVIRPAQHKESTSLRVLMRELVELADLRTEHHQ